MKKNNEIIFFALLMIIAIVGSVFLWLTLYKNNIESFADIKKSETVKLEKKLEMKPGIKLEKKTVSILFLGDLMADRYIRQMIDKKGADYIFSGTRDLTGNQDLTVANLEGPITDSNSKSVNTVPGERNHLIFTFDPIVAPALTKNNIKLVNIGNNHILNFGNDGLVATKKNLSEAGVEYFGGEDVIIKNINGMKIGFINYNQFESCRDALQCVSTVVENIKNLKNQADLVVVYTHWGAEYKTEPAENIKNLGRRFIDSGADLVIGTHPHVVQPAEEYKSKKIYYSLGNFVFDQYFSPETKKGMAVEVKIDTQTKNMNFRDIGLVLDNNGQTRLDSL